MDVQAFWFICGGGKVGIFKRRWGNLMQFQFFLGGSKPFNPSTPWTSLMKSFRRTVQLSFDLINILILVYIFKILNVKCAKAPS